MLNPEEIGWRHNYALYAYRAEQWDDLNRQLPLLGEINYEFFGGKAQYENMVRFARAAVVNGSNIQLHVNTGADLSMVGDASIDFTYSNDVFIHIADASVVR